MFKTLKPWLLHTPGGNNKMLYVGVQDQFYTYTMFDVQALWALKYVLGDIKIPDKETMISSWKDWVDRWAIKKKKDDAQTLRLG